MKKRKIVVILGSKNDLKQCAKGLNTLATYVDQGQADVQIHVRSVHRHPKQLHWLLECLVAERDSGVEIVIIAAAGGAAHLPGCVDAYLRYYLKNITIQVIGVGLKAKGSLINSLAARLSITQVPKTQVNYAGLGKAGFSKACAMAMKPLIKIELPDVPPVLNLTLTQAIELANQG